MTNHDCNDHCSDFLATTAKPYHFLDSGLPNVYLAGIKFWRCEKCARKWASIPAPEQLMNLIAESIVMKPALLSGSEIKFLRKRVGKKAADFAELINKNPQHFSKLETDTLPLIEPTDKLIRLTYGMLSGNTALMSKIASSVEQWLKSIRGKKPRAIKLKNQNNRWVSESVAA